MTIFIQHLRQWIHGLRSGAIEFSTRRFARPLAAINGLHASFHARSDDELRVAAANLRKMARSGVPREQWTN